MLWGFEVLSLLGHFFVVMDEHFRKDSTTQVAMHYTCKFGGSFILKSMPVLPAPASTHSPYNMATCLW